MCCFLLVLSVFVPRLAIFLSWLFSNYMSRAFHDGIWLLLGFIFMPYTTLAYAMAMNQGGGVQGMWALLVVLGVLADFGIIGSAGKARRQRRLNQ